MVEDSGQGFEFTSNTARIGIQGMTKEPATWRISADHQQYRTGARGRVKAKVTDEKIRKRILARAKQIFRKTRIAPMRSELNFFHARS
jgi:hypothetical protein